jgi:sulfoxide reductase heme-binding subunit YedZ
MMPKYLKPLLFILCLTPFISLLYSAFTHQLGPNPVEALIRGFGDWALYFLLMGLAITPTRQLLKLSSLISYRRMLGLFAFFYLCLHFFSYLWFEMFFDWSEIVRDIIKRPFITIGFICFLLLLPLALTSTNKMMRRLKKNWGRLHKLVYPVSLLAMLHYFMMTRADYLQPTLLLLVLMLLLGYRLFKWRAAKAAR